VFGKDFRLSYQNKLAWWGEARDVSPQPLYYSVNSNVFQKPTFKAFVALLNNYERMTGRREIVSNTEINENYRFLDAVLSTPIMKEVYSYLKSQGKASYVASQFRHRLYDLWFRTYYRSARNKIIDSCGFEHVFVGELKNTGAEVTGFHSWIQFYLQEKSKHLNYYGWMKKASSPYLLVAKFDWYNNIKHVGSSFVGTSPEFEFSLYTLVYMLGYERLQFKLDGVDMKITCFGINRNRSIGTCYPDLI